MAVVHFVSYLSWLLFTKPGTLLLAKLMLALELLLPTFNCAQKRLKLVKDF